LKQLDRWLEVGSHWMEGAVSHVMSTVSSAFSPARQATDVIEMLVRDRMASMLRILAMETSRLQFL